MQEYRTNNNTVYKYVVKRSLDSKGAVTIIDTRQAIVNIMRLGELSAREIQLLFRFGRYTRRDRTYHTIEIYNPKEDGKRDEFKRNNDEVVTP